jgi:hypothetical protein
MPPLLVSKNTNHRQRIPAKYSSFRNFSKMLGWLGYSTSNPFTTLKGCHDRSSNGLHLHYSSETNMLEEAAGEFL